ncbi:MAG: hypothetical protein ACR2JY_22630 [Chloroflexota bacterium]
MPSTGATLPPWLRWRAVPGLLAACLAAAVDTFYVAAMRAQRPFGSDVGPSWPRALFLAGVLALAAPAFAVGSLTLHKQCQVTLLAIGTLVCWSWVILGLFPSGSSRSPQPCSAASPCWVLE